MNDNYSEKEYNLDENTKYLGGNYLIYNSILYSGDYKMEKVSINNFKWIGGFYGKDENNIFYEDEKINNIDTNNFEYLGGNYGRSEGVIYYDGTEIDVKDPYFLKYIGGDYSIDNNCVYFEGDIIEEIDVNSFKYIGGDYFEYKDFIYCGEDKTKLDTDTFEYIGGNYGKDKNGVYFRDSIIKGTNIYSFEYIGGNYFLGENEKGGVNTLGYSYGRDNNNIYCDSDKISKIDVTTFEYIGGGYGKDKDYFYSDLLGEGDKQIKDTSYLGGAFLKTENNILFEGIEFNGDVDNSKKSAFSTFLFTGTFGLFISTYTLDYFSFFENIKLLFFSLFIIQGILIFSLLFINKSKLRKYISEAVVVSIIITLMFIYDRFRVISYNESFFNYMFATILIIFISLSIIFQSHFKSSYVNKIKILLLSLTFSYSIIVGLNATLDNSENIIEVTIINKEVKEIDNNKHYYLIMDPIDKKYGNFELLVTKEDYFNISKASNMSYNLKEGYFGIPWQHKFKYKNK